MKISTNSKLPLSFESQLQHYTNFYQIFYFREWIWCPLNFAKPRQMSRRSWARRKMWNIKGNTGVEIQEIQMWNIRGIQGAEKDSEEWCEQEWVPEKRAEAQPKEVTGIYWIKSFKRFSWCLVKWLGKLLKHPIPLNLKLVISFCFAKCSYWKFSSVCGRGQAFSAGALVELWETSALSPTNPGLERLWPREHDSKQEEQVRSVSSASRFLKLIFSSHFCIQVF